MSERPIAAVVVDRAPGLLEMNEVTAVYESVGSDGKPCVKIGVTELTPALRAKLPERIDGYPVVIVETGPVGPR